jgi:G3E family GTPase
MECVRLGMAGSVRCDADDNLKDHLQLDAVLCVVDAKHCLQHIQEDGHGTGTGTTNEAIQQIAFADRILLNKVRLAQPGAGQPPHLSWCLTNPPVDVGDGLQTPRD